MLRLSPAAGRRRFHRAILWSLLLGAGVLLLILATPATPRAQAGVPPVIRNVPLAVDCSRAAQYAKQANPHALDVMQRCAGGSAYSPPAPGARSVPGPGRPAAYGGTDIDLITGPDPAPNSFQSQSFVWGYLNTVVAVYNDRGNQGTTYAGLSYSTDGGSSFTRILPSPFSTGHGDVFGDPTVVYDVNLGRWYAAALAQNCGGQGIGLWTSTNGVNWAPGACAHNGSAGDKPSMWVDNSPFSNHNGRMYLAWNEFGQSGFPFLAYSDDGNTWSTPLRLESRFVRNMSLAGGPDGTVYEAIMDEGGGGTNPRTAYAYRSTDGGATWISHTIGIPFAPPGGPVCNNQYWMGMSGGWYEMGWGQIAVGPDGHVHYVYAPHGAGNDVGDIFYTRSTDSGSTWSTPIRMNTDTGGRDQWTPSLSVSPSNSVMVGWYDRRETTDNSYRYWGRRSTDGGATWLADQPVGDVISPEVNDGWGCRFGINQDSAAEGGTLWYHLMTWTDGRHLIQGTPQDDVYFDQDPPRQGTPTPTPTCGASWQVVPSPNQGSGDNFLTGVAAVSANDVWATGYYTGTGRSLTLIEHWDGTQWSIVPSPNPGQYNNQLNGVAAISTNDVWAVGWYNNDPYYATRHLITMHWDGTAWTEIPNPDPGGNYDNYLMGVGALASNDVWAVGFWREYSPMGLMMRWDGSVWTNESLYSSEIDQYNDVAGAASNDVWTVGGSRSGYPSSQAAHWNGTVWADVPVPDVGMLNGVAVMSTNNAWAVGANGTIHWNGTTWTLFPTPLVGLTDVKAISDNDAWAVSLDGLFMHFDGTSWSHVQGGVPGTLRGISAISSTDIWVAGYHGVGATYQTLVEHYGPICETPTATPTSTNTPVLTPTPTTTACLGAPGCLPTTTPTFTPTPCTIAFSDVQPSDYFYEAVTYLYCHGVISGYADGTFRPYNNTTRGQMTKIIVLAEGWPIVTPTGTPTFSDVPPSNPFYTYVETAVSHGIISGYADGTFRPYDNVTRGQLCKIVVLAEGWQLLCPPSPHFSDVPPDSPFYCYVETAYAHNIISGYSDGTFRPGNSATRGQISKIVYLAITGP